MITMTEEQLKQQRAYARMPILEKVRTLMYRLGQGTIDKKEASLRIEILYQQAPRKTKRKIMVLVTAITKGVEPPV